MRFEDNDLWGLSNSPGGPTPPKTRGRRARATGPTSGQSIRRRNSAHIRASCEHYHEHPQPRNAPSTAISAGGTQSTESTFAGQSPSTSNASRGGLGLTSATFSRNRRTEPQSPRADLCRTPRGAHLRVPPTLLSMKRTIRVDDARRSVDAPLLRRVQHASTCSREHRAARMVPTCHAPRRAAH